MREQKYVGASCLLRLTCFVCYDSYCPRFATLSNRDASASHWWPGASGHAPPSSHTRFSSATLGRWPAAMRKQPSPRTKRCVRPGRTCPKTFSSLDRRSRKSTSRWSRRVRWFQRPSRSHPRFRWIGTWIRFCTRFCVDRCAFFGWLTRVGSLLSAGLGPSVWDWCANRPTSSRRSPTTEATS